MAVINQPEKKLANRTLVQLFLKYLYVTGTFSTGYAVPFICGRTVEQYERETACYSNYEML